MERSQSQASYFDNEEDEELLSDGMIGLKHGPHDTILNTWTPDMCLHAEDEPPEEDQFGRMAYLSKCQELSINPASQVPPRREWISACDVKVHLCCEASTITVRTDDLG